MFGSSSEDFNLVKSVLQWFTVLYSDYSLLQLLFQVLFLNEKLCFSTQKRPEIMVSRVPGEAEHQVTLFDKQFTKKSNLKVFQACYGLIFIYCSWNKYHLCHLMDVAWEERFKSPRRNFCSFYCIFTTPVLLSVSKLVASLYVKYCWYNKYFCLVSPTQMWPEIQLSRIPGGKHWKLSIFVIIECRLYFTVFLLASCLYSMYCVSNCWIYSEVACKKSRVPRCLDWQRILPIIDKNWNCWNKVKSL